MVNSLHVSSSVNQASRLIDGGEPCWQSSGSQGKVGRHGHLLALYPDSFTSSSQMNLENLRDCIAVPPISTCFTFELIIILNVTFDFYCQILNSMRSQTLSPISIGCNRVLHFLLPHVKYTSSESPLARSSFSYVLTDVLALGRLSHLPSPVVTSRGHAGQSCREGLLLQSDSCCVTHSGGYRGTTLDQECTRCFWG